MNARIHRESFAILKVVTARLPAEGMTSASDVELRSSAQPVKKCAAAGTLPPGRRRRIDRSSTSDVTGDGWYR